MKVYWNQKYLETQLRNGKTYLDIARKNGISKSTIQRALQYYDLTSPSLDWTKHELKLLRKSYGHIRNFKKYFPHRTLSSIYHKANRLGLETHMKPKLYPLDETFFKCWNWKMAYVLGWLFSDGNVTSDRRTFRIKLAIKDVEILEKIKKVMHTSAPIKLVYQAVPSKKYIGCYANLAIHSTLMCEDLIRLGCVPNKTSKFAVPSMPENLLSHFVRGYFDGDGSIMFNNPNTIRIRIVGSNKNFIYTLTSIFKRKLAIPINYKKIQNIWQCEYYGDNARKLCGWMYHDCKGLSLYRKRMRFKDHLRKRKLYV